MNERNVSQRSRSRRRPKRAILWCIALLIAYVATYILLSRRGYAEAERYDMEGFYYFTPEESIAWRLKNYGCVALFYPLNLVDRGLGLGRTPAAEPMWRLTS
jgi:4-amino-4-deoxy-L-arabinose transferase-like glycosyltransferase